MFNLDRFGSYITEQRKNAGLTQRQVAESLSISPQAVSLWERGETFPTVDILTQLAALYSVSLDALVGSAELSEREEKIVREIAQASPEEIASLIREGRLSAADLLSCSPFLKASTLSIICAQLGHFGLDISYLTLMHEFIMSEEYVDMVANSDFNKLDKRVFRQFCRFISGDSLMSFFGRILYGEFDYEYLIIILRTMPYFIPDSWIEAAVIEGALPEIFLDYRLNNYVLSIDCKDEES
ncbi:MAG: helix-turn-helix domain-containing protein [Clostridia bacterium]|nr:helix-turn-helix domain-containing protein [Clostridia bacterium]